MDNVIQVNCFVKWPRAEADKLRSIIARLNLCGCGSNAHWECVLELLTEAEKHTDKGFYRDKWFEFGAKVLDSWDLIDHGTGIGWASLNSEGALLLEFLRDFGIDDSSHPIWATEFSWTVEGDDSDHYGEWASLPSQPTQDNA